MMSGMPVIERVLRVVLNDPIDTDTMEQGLDVLSARLGVDTPQTVIAAAIAEAVRRGWLHDPVRLEPGALQCHWRLELTARGRTLTSRS
ncbi:MAG TPA: hypothetical protein VG848_00055 [Acetobacteraceae bacterium]|nr:hypothetical protein [Acetobacteraceae bacterium]